MRQYRSVDPPPRTEEAHWLALPEVQRRYALRAAGKANVGWHAYCLSLVPAQERVRARMLVLGAGTSWLERDLLERHAFARCDVLDPSPEFVEMAKAATPAPEAISYAVADLATVVLPHDAYDAVWSNMTLGYVGDLEHLSAQIARSLKPGGFLFANEYVGPSRYDLSRRQREAIRAAFTLIPARYRHRFGRANLESLTEPALPTPGSEAEAAAPRWSSLVVPALSEHFDIEQYRALGGTLLQFVLEGIAGNFRTEDRASIAALEMLFKIEDVLVETGELGSDFALIVARPKRRGT
jgi:SAM-dependent methyltransferase